MAIFADWIKQTVTGTPGTGAITLGSAVTGYIRLADDTRIVNGSLVYYSIEDGLNRERGIGTYSTTGPTLTRTIRHAKLESGTYSENPGTGLDLTSSAIVTCSAVANAFNFRGALVHHNTTQAVTASVDTPCVFNSELYDTDGFHSTVSNTSRLTVPAGVTRIRLTGGIRFAPDATGVRFGVFWKNGAFLTQSARVGVDVDSAISHTLNLTSPVLTCVPGDYFELVAFHTSSTSPLNLEASSTGHFFAIEVIE